MEDKGQTLDLPMKGSGRSRRRLRLNASSPTKLQKAERSPPKKKTFNLDSVNASNSELTTSCSSDRVHSGGSTLDRRLTRSASKRWLKVYESSAPMLQNETPIASTSMLPPPQPVVPLVRTTTCGMTTRLRFQNSKNGCTDVNRISQNFSQRLSFDQISNTSDYGTASEHSRKCSVASGGMSPISDSGHSCASISGIESLGTSSSDEAAPSQGTAMEWVHQPDPWVGETLDLIRPRVTVHTVEGVIAFIPDVNRSEYSGVFSVTIKDNVDGNKMYR